MLRCWLSYVYVSKLLALGCIRQTMHCQNSLGRNTCQKTTVALHRKPGLQQIFGSIGLYTKECAAGLVRVSSSGAFKATRLQWLHRDDEKVSCTCSCGTIFWRKKAQAKIESKDRIAPQVNFIQSSEKVVEVARRKKKGKRRWWRVDHFESCM